MADTPQKPQISTKWYVVEKEKYPSFGKDRKYMPYVSSSTSEPTVTSAQDKLLVEYVDYDDNVKDVHLHTDPFALTGWSNVGKTYGQCEDWLFYDGTGQPDPDHSNALKGGWAALDLMYYYYDNSTMEYKGSGKWSETPSGCTAVFNNAPLDSNGELANDGEYSITWNGNGWTVTKKTIPTNWDKVYSVTSIAYSSTTDAVEWVATNGKDDPPSGDILLQLREAYSHSDIETNSVALFQKPVYITINGTRFRMWQNGNGSGFQGGITMQAGYEVPAGVHSCDLKSGRCHFQGEWSYFFTGSRSTEQFRFFSMNTGSTNGNTYGARPKQTLLRLQYGSTYQPVVGSDLDYWYFWFGNTYLLYKPYWNGLPISNTNYNIPAGDYLAAFTSDSVYIYDAKYTPISKTVTNLTVMVPSTAGTYGEVDYAFSQYNTYTLGFYSAWENYTQVGSLTFRVPNTSFVYSTPLWSSNGTYCLINIQLSSTKLRIKAPSGSAALGKTLTVSVIDYNR